MHVVAHCTRDTNAARRTFSLEPDRDIHAVAVDVGTLSYDIADVDANAEPDGPVQRLIAIEQGDLLLNGNSRAYCAVDAVEYDQQRVAASLGNSATMFADGRIYQFPPKRLQPGNRSRVIKSYQAAIAGHVGIDHSNQPAAARCLASTVRINADGGHGQQGSTNAGATIKLAPWRTALLDWPP